MGLSWGRPSRDVRLSLDSYQKLSGTVLEPWQVPLFAANVVEVLEKIHDPRLARRERDKFLRGLRGCPQRELVKGYLGRWSSRGTIRGTSRGGNAALGLGERDR